MPPVQWLLQVLPVLLYPKSWQGLQLKCIFADAVPSGELGVLREEFQQLKAAVEVLTNATHLMAIPAPNRPSSPPTAATPSEPPGISLFNFSFPLFVQFFCFSNIKNNAGR